MYPYSQSDPCCSGPDKHPSDSALLCGRNKCLNHGTSVEGLRWFHTLRSPSVCCTEMSRESSKMGEREACTQTCPSCDLPTKRGGGEHPTLHRACSPGTGCERPLEADKHTPAVMGWSWGISVLQRVHYSSWHQATLPARRAQLCHSSSWHWFQREHHARLYCCLTAKERQVSAQSNSTSSKVWKLQSSPSAWWRAR